jgi:hypothetical protein
VTTRRDMLLALGAGVVTTPLAAFAQQQPGKIARIGFLAISSASGVAGNVEALRAGLRDLGYEEGRNTIFEFRWADGKYERLPDFAAELVRFKVDIIVTSGTPAILAAKQATTTIPIVMAAGGDAVVAGLITSLARPGGGHHRIDHLQPGTRGETAGVDRAGPSTCHPDCSALDSRQCQTKWLETPSDGDDRSVTQDGASTIRSARPERIRERLCRDGARSPPICRSSSLPESSSLSIARPPRRSGSRSRRRCCCARTR